jgi:23S rRNA pseudouridine1911/1915/1917 synthase
VQRPGIVHRIDKDTSGALVITKSDAAHQGLSKLFATHDIERTYHALCYGALKQTSSTIKSLIGRSPTDRKKMTMNVKEGRHAVTHIKRLREYADRNKKGEHSIFSTLIEARLETGRTHQIRVHLTGLDHSLLGDPVYGTPGERHPKWLALPDDIKQAVKNLPGQALHARTLGFVHPITGQKLQFEAPYFEAFETLMRALERYA